MYPKLQNGLKSSSGVVIMYPKLQNRTTTFYETIMNLLPVPSVYQLTLQYAYVK